MQPVVEALGQDQPDDELAPRVLLPLRVAARTPRRQARLQRRRMIEQADVALGALQELLVVLLALGTYHGHGQSSFCRDSGHGAAQPPAAPSIIEPAQL